jgi:hypothetical protein
VAGTSLGCMALLGNLMTLVGGVVISIAGAAPNLTDVEKAGLTSGGTAAAFCGAILVLANYLLGRSIQPPKHLPAPSPTSAAWTVFSTFFGVCAPEVLNFSGAVLPGPM